MNTPSLEKNTPRTRSERPSMILRGPRKPYVPGVREPIKLPDQTVQLPGPDPLPGPPPVLNWLTAVLPPILIMGSMGVMVLINPSTNAWMMIPSVLMSLGFPLANVVGLQMQKRNYKKNLVERETRYRRALDQERSRLGSLAQEQRSKMESLYPRTKTALDLALARGSKSRLWYRRPQDSDFLCLRVGLGSQHALFSATPPNMIDRNDPLIGLPGEVQQEFLEILDLPFAIDLKTIGSLAVVGRDSASASGMLNHLILDLLIHHSPQDVQLLLLTDQDDWNDRWGWMKWAPHTRALSPSDNVRRIAYRMGTVGDALEWLKQTYFKRKTPQASGFSTEGDNSAVVVIVDDNNKIRQLQTLAPIVKDGFEVGIHLIFLGEQFLPRVRGRLDVSDQGAFRYVETWEGGTTQGGKAEFVDRQEIEAAARALSQLELLGGKNSVVLPDSLRLFQLFEVVKPTSQDVAENWNLPLSDRELLQFPIGVYAGRDGLEPLVINLLPADRGGSDAYHTILIGTTGSGKSEFMKSLVMAAAYKYSPRILNFFFLDFKGGAAFKVFEQLPHVSGIVTNLEPELVERGLIAVENEIERRQEKFAQAGVKDIWVYNQMRSSQPLPHLVLLLDEFAKGLVEFPQLKEPLELLVRQGRSLGMYLILANQDVNSAVDSLLNNVGWRIALKVAKKEEMHIIDKHLDPTRRAGHGYLRSSAGDIYEFQASYAGQPLQEYSANAGEDFLISRVEPDGLMKTLYKHSGSLGTDNSLNKSPPKEEEFLISTLCQASEELQIESNSTHLSGSVASKKRTWESSGRDKGPSQLSGRGKLERNSGSSAAVVRASWLC